MPLDGSLLRSVQSGQAVNRISWSFCKGSPSAEPAMCSGSNQTVLDFLPCTKHLKAEKWSLKGSIVLHAAAMDETADSKAFVPSS
mmetsp:Transcript_37555/g.70106  ORF Transcript_37555/g.70106 Transcript_37555/m.70106 type:complete len:85 (+) Transcript_37555:96-350(+)